MSNLASPMQVASVASALIWPLAAGVAVVIWSKARASAHAKRVAAMETQLQGLYRTVEDNPVPSRLTMVVEALEEGEALAVAGTPTGKVGAKTAAGS